MSSRTTPEQVLGNLFQFVINLKQKGIGVTRRTQALGSAAVDTLFREGWVIVRHDDLPKMESKFSQMRDVARILYDLASKHTDHWTPEDYDRFRSARDNLSGRTS